MTALERPARPNVKCVIGTMFAVGSFTAACVAVEPVLKVAALLVTIGAGLITIRNGLKKKKD